MKVHSVFQNSDLASTKVREWQIFLEQNKFDLSVLKKIDMSGEVPAMFDRAGNKFAIDFNNDIRNYKKKKLSLKSELISKAMGAGRYGMKILDLSAGLGIDSVFLAQLGYEVTAVERHPLIYLALKEALALKADLQLRIEFADALKFLQQGDVEADVVYFDPMFPEKVKSALPRQEMVFFKGLVGNDSDAAGVLSAALNLKNIKRVVVKRPLKAPVLGLKPQASVSGKLIRFDIYGVKK